MSKLDGDKWELGDTTDAKALPRPRVVPSVPILSPTVIVVLAQERLGVPIVPDVPDVPTLII
jgi:hypothetical protein